MKYLLLSFCIFLFSCGTGSNRVKFEKPQPASGKALTAFEPVIQGVYVDIEDSLDGLVINEKEIINISYDFTNFHRSELKEDSSVKFDISNDKMVLDYLSSLGIQAKIMNDTVYCKIIAKDTLFSIDKNHILKKLNENYFASIRSDEYWNVHLINKANDTLYWRRIRPSDDLLQYKFVREEVEYVIDSLGNPIEKDTSSIVYILNPHKKGFKTLINDGNFKVSKRFIKKESPAKAG